jgi:hypothetical protein
VTHSNDFANQLTKLRNNFQELVLGIQGKKVIFFVGAGISLGAPTNIETAKELVLRLKDKFGHFNWWAEPLFNLWKLKTNQQITTARMPAQGMRFLHLWAKNVHSPLQKADGPLLGILQALAILVG